MEKYKYSALLIVLFGLISVGSTALHAASDSFCSNYAKLSVGQYQASIDAQCKFSGTRWKNDFDGQKKWCLTVQESAASVETVARAEALIQCKSTKAEGLVSSEKEKLIKPLVDTAVDVDAIKQIISQSSNLELKLAGNAIVCSN